MSVIFDYNLSSGDKTGLSEVYTGSSDISVTNGAALAGTNYGLAILLDDANANYLYNSDYASHNHTGGRFRARLYVDPNSATWGSGETVTLFGLRGSSQYKCIIQLLYISTTWRIRADIYNDAGGTSGTTAYTITDAPHYIEIDLIRATNSTSNDGSLQLWIDGESKETISGVDNYDRLATVSAFYWGALTKPSSLSGTIYMDELVVNDDRLGHRRRA